MNDSTECISLKDEISIQLGGKDKEVGHEISKVGKPKVTLEDKRQKEKDKRGHYYLLQTDLNQKQIDDQQVMESYKELMKVEKSFRDIKIQIKIRPIRHWKENKITGHIYLCYLSL